MKDLEDQLYTEEDTQVEVVVAGQDKSGEELRELIKKSYISLIKKKIEERDL